MLNICIYSNIFSRIYSFLNIFSHFQLAKYIWTFVHTIFCLPNIFGYSLGLFSATQIYLNIHSDYYEHPKYIWIFICTPKNYLAFTASSNGYSMYSASSSMHTCTVPVAVYSAGSSVYICTVPVAVCTVPVGVQTGCKCKQCTVTVSADTAFPTSHSGREREADMMSWNMTATPCFLYLLRRSSSSLSSSSSSLSSSSTISLPRVVVVGAGWAGFRVARDLDKKKYHVTVLSPRYCNVLCTAMYCVL